MLNSETDLKTEFVHRKNYSHTISLILCGNINRSWYHLVWLETQRQCIRIQHLFTSHSTNIKSYLIQTVLNQLRSYEKTPVPSKQWKGHTSFTHQSLPSVSYSCQTCLFIFKVNLVLSTTCLQSSVARG